MFKKTFKILAKCIIIIKINYKFTIGQEANVWLHKNTTKNNKMDGFNSVTLCGTLGSDPEYSQITSKASGKTTPKALINMVTNRTYMDASGNKQQDSHWHTIEVWGAQADVVKNFTKKETPY